MPTALIIEDNRMNMQLATDLLDVAGFEVLQAFTAEEGLELAQTALPDVIVMDIGLPGMDGLEAVRRLRVGGETRHIPILVTTSHAMTEDREQAMAAGADVFITKPIDTRGFVEQVKRAIK